ncbi:MAG: metallophosphoesterase [Myxococcota bacterium]|nr:metallophosphoesterase [Myxococcota bacterium]
MQRIFVGDIQGCADELDELLDRATSRFGKRFELWAVGDLINRGPANLRVLERVHELWAKGRAFPILGNHEIALLRTALGLRTPSRLDTLGEVLDSPDGSFWFEWLRSLPLVRADEIGGFPFLMVHAAAFPGWSLPETVRRVGKIEAQLQGTPAVLRKLLARDHGADSGSRIARAADRLGHLVSCRSLSEDGAWSDAEPSGGSVPWHECFAPDESDYGVVYGHWSLQGLHVASGIRGLDTGCVHHGRSGDGFLTAWLPDDRGEPFAVPDTRFWKIRGHRRYLPRD